MGDESASEQWKVIEALNGTLTLALALTLTLRLTLPLPEPLPLPRAPAPALALTRTLPLTRLLPRWAAPRGEGGNPTGLPRFQSAWLRGITSNITVTLSLTLTLAPTLTIASNITSESRSRSSNSIYQIPITEHVTYRRVLRPRSPQWRGSS